jgi:TetR/AcrR family transcriptional regulator, fatty acid metabolism regulator protein
MPTRKNDKMTFIEEARRKQLVEVAIETIATEGFINTTLADIARRADISKGVISYHFDNKDELISEVIHALLRDSYEYIRPRVDAVSPAPDKLSAYVRASFEYMALYPDRAAAQVDLWGSFVSTDAKRDFNTTAYDPCRFLSIILRQGHEEDSLRPVSVTALAATIQAMIDGLMIQWVFNSEAVSLNDCTEQMIAMLTAYLLPTQNDSTDA